MSSLSGLLSHLGLPMSDRTLPFRAAMVVTYILDSAGYFWNIFRLRHFDVKGSRLASGSGSQ
jgi:hypothetical protein